MQFRLLGPPELQRMRDGLLQRISSLCGGLSRLIADISDTVRAIGEVARTDLFKA
jgi:hypothetical protein